HRRTDPGLAHGLAFGLVHARALAASLRRSADVGELAASYVEATARALRERYQLATALDEQRLQHWRGEQIDYAHRDGAYAMFSVTAAGGAALADPEIFRVFV